MRTQLRGQDVLVGEGEGTSAADHPFVQAVRPLLDNFREAYWIAAQSLLELPAAGMTEKALIDRMRKRYRTGLLLGEVRKPEGNSSVTLANAISRFAELDAIERRAASKGKERQVLPGPRHEALRALAERLGIGIVGG